MNPREKPELDKLNSRLIVTFRLFDTTSRALRFGCPNGWWVIAPDVYTLRTPSARKMQLEKGNSACIAVV